MYSWDSLRKANESIVTTDIKGKDYAEVNQRIKAFRMVCPGGGIHTDMVSNENGVCVFRATVLDEEQNVLGTGTAYEKESSSFINKTSYIENCETSAVGRALGMCGFGIDTSVASYEEVTNAINNQGDKKKSGSGNKKEEGERNPELSSQMIGELLFLAEQTGTNTEAIMNAYHVTNFYCLTTPQYWNAIKTLKAKRDEMYPPEQTALEDVIDPEGVPQ